VANYLICVAKLFVNYPSVVDQPGDPRIKSYLYGPTDKKLPVLFFTLSLGYGGKGANEIWCSSSKLTDNLVEWLTCYEMWKLRLRLGI